MTDVCNFANDTTFFACDSNFKHLLERLKHDTKLTIEWFENNYMKLNEDKCHLLEYIDVNLYGLKQGKPGFGCGFESRCSHLNFRIRACFEQGVP